MADEEDADHVNGDTSRLSRVSSEDSEAAGPHRVAPENPWLEADVPAAPPNNVRLQPCFGVLPEAVACVSVPGFGAPIPSVLVVLRKEMERLGGVFKEGIFRLAPNQDDLVYTKKLLQSGGYGFAASGCCNDPYLAANLIKVWFREMPVQMFSVVSPDRLLEMADGGEHQAITLIYTEFQEPIQSWMLWLLDLLATIAVNERFNRMPARNLATVFTPNLFDPMAHGSGGMGVTTGALEATAKVVGFLVSALESFLILKFGFYGLEHMPATLLPIDAGVHGEEVAEKPDGPPGHTGDGLPTVGEVYYF